MLKHSITVLVVTSMIGLPLGLNPALADNPMGYKLLSADQASGLPRMGGALGMSVGPDKQITDDGMTFEVLRVNGVGQNSAGGQAGFRTGDEIISVDGHVFPSVAAFAGYVGSIQPGRQISVDYIPAGGGPQQAQRIDVTLGEAGRPVPAQQQDAPGSRGRYVHRHQGRHRGRSRCAPLLQVSLLRQAEAALRHDASAAATADAVKHRADAVSLS